MSMRNCGCVQRHDHHGHEDDRDQNGTAAAAASAYHEPVCNGITSVKECVRRHVVYTW